MAPKEALVISDKDQMRKWSRAMRCQGKVIGLVPTMGYLHEGHLSLVREAHKHAHVVAVSIYVNPGQFSPTEDLSTYPSDFDGDIQKLMSVPGGVDVVFHPHNLYDYGNHTRDGGVVKGDPDRDGDGVVSCIEKSGLGHETWVRVEMLEKGLCGKSRPIFFRGVATIVTKLFNIVEPDVAVFGKKDYQQWRIIQRMVRDLDFSIKIIGSEISREKDGLAMSSRNVHLSPEEREKALSINRSLFIAKSSAEEGQVNCEKLRNSVIQCITEAGGRIDYAEILDLGFFLWMVTKLSLGAMEDRMEGLERQMTDQGRMMETMMRRLEELITRQQQPPPLDDVVNSRISDPGGGQCRNPTQYKGNYNRRITVPPFDGSDASGCLIQMDRFFQISKIQV